MDDLRGCRSLDCSLEKTLLFELFESGRQAFRGDALEGLEKLVEPVYSVDADISDDGHGPFLAENIERSLDRAVYEFGLDESRLNVSVRSSESGFWD